MTGPHDPPNLDDVIEPEEHPTRDRTRHGKDPHPDDEVLEHRTEQERQAVGSDDAAPAGPQPPPPTHRKRTPLPPTTRTLAAGPCRRALAVGDVACWVLKTTRPPAELAPGWAPPAA